MNAQLFHTVYSYAGHFRCVPVYKFFRFSSYIFLILFLTVFITNSAYINKQIKRKLFYIDYKYTFSFSYLPGQKVRPSFFLGEFSEVAYVGEFEFDFKFNIKNPGQKRTVLDTSFLPGFFIIQVHSSFNEKTLSHNKV